MVQLLLAISYMRTLSHHKYSKDLAVRLTLLVPYRELVGFLFVRAITGLRMEVYIDERSKKTGKERR